MIRASILEFIARVACRQYRIVLLVALLLTALSIIPPATNRMHSAFNLAKMLPQDIPEAYAFTRAVVDFDSIDEAVVVFHLGSPADTSAQSREKYLPVAGRIAEEIATRLQKSPDIKNAFCKLYSKEDKDFFIEDELPRRGLLLVDEEELPLVAEALTPGKIRRSVLKTKRRIMTSVSSVGDAENLIAMDALGLGSIFKRTLERYGVTSEKGGLGFIANKDRTMLLLVIQPSKPAQSAGFASKIMETIETVTRDVYESSIPPASRSGIRFEFGGGYEIARTYQTSVAHTLYYSLLTSLFGVIILFGYCFRRPGVLIYIGLPLSMTVAWTIGVGSLIFGQLNMVSCAFAAVLVGLGVDYAIHIYNRYVEERAGGLDVEEAFAMSLSHTGWGVFIGMATTSLAFLALKATRFTQLSEFGVLAGIGIFLSVPSMLFVLPALITWRNKTKKEHARAMRPTSFFLPQIADFVATHRRVVLAVGVLLAAGSALLLVISPVNYRLAFDKRISSLRPQERAFELGGEIAKAFANRNPNKLMLLAYGEDEEEALEQAARLEAGCVALTKQTYRGEPMLRAYKSVMRYLPAPSTQRRRLAMLRKIDFTAALKTFREALARNNLLEADFHFSISLLEQHAKLIEESRIILPSDYRSTPLWRHIRRMVTRRRQALDLREPLPAELTFPVVLAKPAMSRKDEVKAPEGARLSREELLALYYNQQLNAEDLVKRVTLFEKGWTVKTSVYPPVISESKSADLNIDDEWIRRAKQTLGLKNDIDASRNDAFLTGMGLLAHALAAVVKEDFWRVSFAVFGVAVLVLTIFFHRHPIRVLYSLLPIIFGLLYLFGFMCITSIPFNFVNVLAVPIIIGLGVDNGIHLVERFYESRRQIRPMIADTGRAIMITSLTSIIGFGSLAVGGYRGITSMGVLSILALTANLIVSLLVFPAILATFSPPEAAPLNPEDDED